MHSFRKFLNISLLVITILLAPASATAAQVVDINRADAATMIENWKGIGEKKARDIVSYRKSNGPFASVDDLANVKGIGEGIIKNNRKLMSVSKGVSKATNKKSSTKKDTAKDKKKSTDSKKKTKDSSSGKKSVSKKSEKKSESKTSTKKKSTAKKSTSKTKKKKCKSGSKDKDCKAQKSKKKKSTT